MPAEHPCRAIISEKETKTAHQLTNQRPARGKPTAYQEPFHAGMRKALANSTRPGDNQDELNIQGAEDHQCRDEKPCKSHARLSYQPKHNMTTSQDTTKGHPFILADAAPPCKRKFTQSSQATKLFSSPCRNRGTEAKQCRDVEAMHVPCKNHARPYT